MIKLLKKLIQIILVLAAASLVFFYGVNAYIVDKESVKVYDKENLPADSGRDCILILGCGVRSDGTPSAMLADRLEQGIALYKSGAAPKIIMSGDHGRADYDEVNVMKKIAEENGVLPEDIFMDHAGFSTYDSIYRAKEIFQANKVVIVTQKYHLYRSIYIAKKLGMEAYGVASNPRPYAGQWAREAREIVARNKDFFKVLIKPQSTYLGETIPVSGNGNATNDK